MRKIMSGNENSVRATRTPLRGITNEERRLRLAGQLGAIAILFGLVGVLAAITPGTPQVGPFAHVAQVVSTDE
jgi:hypothetical protein